MKLVLSLAKKSKQEVATIQKKKEKAEAEASDDETGDVNDIRRTTTNFNYPNVTEKERQNR